MSTKIHVAYRTLAGPGLWPLLWSIKARGRAEAKARFTQVYRDILDGRAQATIDWYAQAERALADWAGEQGIVSPSERLFALARGDFRPADAIGPKPSSLVAVADSAVRLNGDGLRPSLLDVDAWCTRQYRDQLASPHRSSWHLDVSVAVRFDGRWAYLIPHCDSASLMRGVLDFLEDMPELADYAYWNNTDRPDDVSARAWQDRAALWSRLIERWDDYVEVDVVSWATFSAVCPMRDLAAEYRHTFVPAVSE